MEDKIRIFAIVGCFIIGIIFFIISIKSKPHKLIKSPFKAIFKKDIQSKSIGNYIYTIHSKNIEKRIGCVIFFIIATVSLILMFIKFDAIFLVACIMSLILAIFRFIDSTQKIIIYENAIEHKTIKKSKIFHLNEIDFIEVFNRVNSFNKGTSWGYGLIKNGVSIFKFEDRDYKNLDYIEELFTKNNKNVEEIIW